MLSHLSSSAPSPSGGQLEGEFLTPRLTKDSLTFHSLEDSMSHIDLSLISELRILEIHQLTLYQTTIQPIPGTSSTIPFHQFLIPLLSTIKSEITEITLHIWMSQEWHLDSLEWEKMAVLFLTPPFRKLKRLGVHVRGMEGDGVKTWISKRLGHETIISILEVWFVTCAY